MRILVVEDDTTLAAQLRAALEGAGFSVDVEATILRYQKGQPVQGFVVTARKPT